MKKLFYLLKNIVLATFDYLFLFIGLNLLLSWHIALFFPLEQDSFVLGAFVLIICVAIWIGNCILQIKIGKELFNLNLHPYRGIVLSLVTLYLATVLCCVMNTGFIDIFMFPGYVICEYVLFELLFFNLSIYMGIGCYVFCFISAILYFAPFLCLLIGSHKRYKEEKTGDSTVS